MKKLANVAAWLALGLSIIVALVGGNRVPGLATAVVAGVAVWWLSKHDKATIRRCVEAVLHYAAPSFLQRRVSNATQSNRRQQFEATRRVLDIAAWAAVAIFVAMGIWIGGGWPLMFIDSLGKMPVQLFIIIVDGVPMVLGATWLVLRAMERMRSRL